MSVYSALPCHAIVRTKTAREGERQYRWKRMKFTGHLLPTVLYGASPKTERSHFGFFTIFNSSVYSRWQPAGHHLIQNWIIWFFVVVRRVNFYAFCSAYYMYVCIPCRRCTCAEPCSRSVPVYTIYGDLYTHIHSIAHAFTTIYSHSSRPLCMLIEWGYCYGDKGPTTIQKGPEVLYIYILASQAQSYYTDQPFSHSVRSLSTLYDRDAARTAEEPIRIESEFCGSRILYCIREPHPGQPDQWVRITHTCTYNVLYEQI